MHWEMSLPSLDLNLKAQTVSAPEFSASVSSAKVSGSLKGSKIFDKPDVAGSLALAPLVLREFAQRFHVDLPKTQDPKALSAFSFNSSFAYDGDAATLNGINIKLDDTTMKGNVKVELGKIERVTFALTTDRIDLDRYRPPAGATPDPQSSEANKPAPQKADATPLEAHGTFALSSAHAAGLDLSNLAVTVDLNDHITHLHPLEAQLYGGKYSGDLTYDARTATPALSMDEHLAQVDVAQLLANTHLKGRVSGKASINIKGTARGAEADAIMKTLNGHFDANVANGALEGLDLSYDISMAQALLSKQAGTSQSNTKRTPFDAFKMSAQIVNGVAETKDLIISSPVLKVAGQGTVTLPTSGIDMALNASVMKTATASALDIPVKVTGKYTDPTVRPDVEALAKGQVKQKLQDVLKKNGLQGLFSH
jgi:AsmA protein